MMKSRAWMAALALAFLILALATKSELAQVPDVRASAAGGFDTPRALARLQRILGDQRPHSADTAANDAVRGRLIAELRAIGLSPTVTDDFVCNGDERVRALSCARVRNVLATIGPGEGRHVLMAAHYDSTIVGPGAADAGIGVAVLLETAALLRNRPLKRPVTLLFNEGEEMGLLGARAFLDRNPLAGRVAAAVNLEARGVTGPAFMFETSRPNGAAIGAFSRAAVRPVANSLMTDFYGLIPNSTDVALFKERDWTILNFAIIGNETRYHSGGDNMAALDPRSVAHMGRQALAVTQELATAETIGEAAGESIYADLLGRGFVSLPRWLGVAAVWLLLAGFAVLVWRRRRGTGRAAGVIVLALADAALAVFLLQRVAGWLRPGEFWRAHPDALALAIDLTALAAAAAALLWLAAPVPRDALRRAWWLLFLMLGAAVTLVAPGASIFFLLPPILAGAALLAGRGGRLLHLAAWAVLFLGLGPLLYLMGVLLDFDAGWMFAPLAVLLVMPVLIELKPALGGERRGGVTAGLAGGALLAWGAALLLPAYSADRKQAFGIDYVREGAAAQWMAVNDGAPLPPGFSAFSKPVEVEWSWRRRHAAPAPAPADPMPVLAEKLGERQTAAGRVVTLRLSTGGGETVSIKAPGDADLRAASIGGVERRFGRGQPEQPFHLRCAGRSCDGATLELLTGSSKPVELVVSAVRAGLPPSAAPLLAARPAHAAPQYHPDATVYVARLKV
jgi:hypothetical protein